MTDIADKLPADLFNPGRLPKRDVDGYASHPDSDLIFELLGVDDEGESCYQFIKSLGYEFATDGIDYPLEDEMDCSSWEPEKPDGEGWILVWIAPCEDGPFATYLRKKP